MGKAKAKTKAFPDWPLYDNREKELLNKSFRKQSLVESYWQYG